MPFATALRLLRVSLLSLLCLPFSGELAAEGSVDFRNYPGYRLWLDTRTPQQLKVYAAAGEFINVGASHLGLSQGYIKVYRPDGTLHSTFDNTGATAGKGIINNSIQELNGPTGNGTGYEPGVVAVQTGEAGIWTVRIAYPDFQITGFNNLLNGQAWNRIQHQPTGPRVILAWDITVSQNAAGDQGGTLLTGRVFSKEYVSIINKNGFTTSPKFYVLSEDGYQYTVNFNETDPFRFPILSNRNGYVNADRTRTYRSQDRYDIIRSAAPTTWVDGEIYLFDPQAPDYQDELVTNKLFFNPASPDLPAQALITDIFTNTTYSTWLRNDPVAYTGSVDGFEALSYDPQSGDLCGVNVLDPSEGGYLKYTTNVEGPTRILLDIDGNGQYTDPVDVVLHAFTTAGTNSIFWDGKDGFGNAIPTQTGFELRYKFDIRGGETHILLSDVENSAGGITFGLIQPDGSETPIAFYYDHSKIDGGVSGGGTPGNPQATTTPYTYGNNYGNNRNLDYWTYVDLVGSQTGTQLIDIVDECARTNDSDGDGIEDTVDIDDDNDGIFDAQEYCHPGNGFACLPGALDPSGDVDNDGIANYNDVDAQAAGQCADADNDGVCDSTPARYDRDGDGVPDHLDLDSDNDGISDLTEARYTDLDADADGIIDGPPAVFGANGGFNGLASDPDAPLAVSTQTPPDHDGDGLPDHDDLDSDNDGLHDVIEAGYYDQDQNEDGTLDAAATGVGLTGLAPLIDPTQTGTDITAPTNWDTDDVPDYLDRDSDNDGILDTKEISLTDPDDDGVVGNGTPTVDSDGRVVAGGIALVTSRPTDHDFDTVPDWHDHDTDNDGIRDVVEAGFSDDDMSGEPGNGPVDVDAFGVPTGDAFGQTFAATSNPSNVDGDNRADFRDRDSDNDGLNDVAEALLPDGDNDGELGTGEPSINAFGEPVDDGQMGPVQISSTPIDSDLDGAADFRDLDSDADGLSDVVEILLPDADDDGMIGTGTPVVNQYGQAFAFLPAGPTSAAVDSDTDGLPDYRDLDSDDDGISDTDECPDDNTCVDGDADGLPDYRDTDRDNDGIVDSYECPDGGPCMDTDNDGIPDVDDLDSDGDGFPDAEECPTGAPCADSDQNGTDDFQQITCGGTAAVATAVNPTGAGSYCAGTDVTLSATNGTPLGGVVTYIWFGPDNFSFQSDAPAAGPFPLPLDAIDADQAGQYVLIINTANGCPSEPLQFTVGVEQAPAQPVAQAAQSMLCANDDAQLSVSNPQAGATYTWTHQNSGTTLTTTTPTVTFNGIGAGVYTVTASLAGCASAESAAVEIEAETPLDFTEIAGAGSYCAGSDVLLLANAEGEPGTQVTYVYTAPDGTTFGQTVAVEADYTLLLENIQPDQEGDYTLTVTTEAGCTVLYDTPFSVGITAALPTPVLTSDVQSICGGGAITLTTDPVGGAAYDWYADGALVATTDEPSLTTSVAADQQFTVLTSVGDCGSALSDPVSVQVIPAPVLSGFAPVGSVCAGETYVLAGALSSSFDVQLTLTDPAGNITTFPLTAGTPTLSVNLTGLDDGASGIYTLVASNLAGDCVSDPIEVELTVLPLPATPAIDADADLICANTTAELTTAPVSGATYRWFGDGQLLGTSVVPVFAVSPAANTAYSVRLDVDGCVSDYSDERDIEVEDNPIYLVSNATSPSMAFCPGDEVLLELTGTTTGTINWFGPGGYTSTEWSPLLTDLSGDAAGDYYAEIVTAAGCAVTTAVTTVYVQPEIGASDDVLTVAFGAAGQASVLLNDQLSDPDAIQISIVNTPANGTALVNGRTVNYIPESGFSGTDVFTYEVCELDCPDNCARAKVVVTVEEEVVDPVDPTDPTNPTVPGAPCAMPDIFTPNDDGVNDFLRVPCMDTPEYARAALTIFNRRGDRLFSAQPYQNDFDGRYRGQLLPAGTYYYILQPDPDVDDCRAGYFTLTR